MQIFLKMSHLLYAYVDLFDILRIIRIELEDIQ